MATSFVVAACAAPSADRTSETEQHAVTSGLATFSAIAPFRMLETRPGESDGEGYTSARFGRRFAPGETRCIPIRGRGGIPGDAIAAVLNVTAVNPGSDGRAIPGDGFLTVWGEGNGKPATSNVNFGPGEIIPNLAVIPFGSTNSLCIYNHVTSAVDVVVDANGYFVNDANGTRGGLFNPVTPTNVLDTYNTVDRGVFNVPIVGRTIYGEAGAYTIPASATGVVVNVRMEDAEYAGYVTAFPGGAPPKASNLNIVPGRSRANVAFVGLQGGAISIAAQPKGRIFVDLLGYFDATRGLFFQGVDPTRVYDSRAPGQYSGSPPPGENTLFDTNSARLIAVTGLGGIPSASAALVNLTTTEARGSGAMTVGDLSGQTKTVYFSPGTNTPNAAIAKLTPGGNALVYSSSTTHAIVDVFGIFVKPPPSAPKAPAPEPPDLGTHAVPLPTPPNDFETNPGHVLPGAVRVGNDSSFFWLCNGIDSLPPGVYPSDVKGLCRAVHPSWGETVRLASDLKTALVAKLPPLSMGTTIPTVQGAAVIPAIAVDGLPRLIYEVCYPTEVTNVGNIPVAFRCLYKADARDYFWTHSATSKQPGDKNVNGWAAAMCISGTIVALLKPQAASATVGAACDWTVD